MIAVDQAGVQAAPVVDYLNSDPSGTQPETWRAKEADNSLVVLASNPSGNTQTGTSTWSLFGIPGPVMVRDLWNGVNLIGTPNEDGGYQIPGALPFGLSEPAPKGDAYGAGNAISGERPEFAAAGFSCVCACQYLQRLSGSPALADVKASSSKAVAVNFPSTSGNPGNSDVVGVANVNLDLRQGSNTITIFSVSKETAPDLDSIIVVE